MEQTTVRTFETERAWPLSASQSSFVDDGNEKTVAVSGD
jgi:hypothetical protein